MKPRTKLQHEVIRCSRQLRCLSQRELDWARLHCFEHKGFATKTRVICMDCGETFSPDLVHRKRAICPNCETKLKIENTRKRTDKQQAYFTIAEVYFGFQIIRNWEILINYAKGVEAEVFCHEVLQHWICAETGKREVVAKLHYFNVSCDSWGGEMAIRKEKNRWYYGGARYDIYPTRIHPNSAFLHKYEFHGIDHQLIGLTPLEAINFIPGNSRAETLLKAKQYSLLYIHEQGRDGVWRHWPSIKICMRNKYIVKDAPMYIDYLDSLLYFHKDLRNAHYVCPKNLKKAHNFWMDKKRKAIEKQREEDKIMRAIKYDKTFKELKQPYFGIAFSQGNINVKVLESLEEFKAEGDALHHCVFANEYYLKPNSLILSARIENKPIETVEVSLKKLEVIQARGLQNQPSEYHQQIVHLVNERMPQIAKIVENKSTELCKTASI